MDTPRTAAGQKLDHLWGADVDRLRHRKLILATEAEAAAPAEGLDVAFLKAYWAGMADEADNWDASPERLAAIGKAFAVEYLAAEASPPSGALREAFARSGNARSGLPTDADLERYRAAPAEGLDAERLARALDATDYVIVDNDLGIVNSISDLEEVAAEYARLMAADD